MEKGGNKGKARSAEGVGWGGVGGREAGSSCGSRPNSGLRPEPEPQQLSAFPLLQTPFQEEGLCFPLLKWGVGVTLSRNQVNMIIFHFSYLNLLLHLNRL